MINIAVTSVDVPVGGGAPTVSLALTNDLEQGLRGLPAGDIRFVISQLSPGVNGGSSEWQSYVTRSSNVRNPLEQWCCQRTGDYRKSLQRNIRRQQ